MKKLIVFLFAGIIFLPLILGGVSLVSDQKLDVELKGYFDEVAEPEVGLDQIKTGEFQSSFTNWFDNTFLPRGVLIQTYNTIRYNFLNLGNQIIGKNKDVFEPDYVNAELCIGDEHDYSLPERRAELENYVSELVQVNEKLQKIGKKLYVYITPSKASSHRENLPYTYTVLQADEKVRCVDYFCELMDQVGLPYFNSSSIEDELEYPAFYTTGIHWSRTYEQLVTQKVISELSLLMEKPYRNISLGEVKVSEEPFNRDSDVFDLLNVWNSYGVEEFYEYESSMEFPEAYEKMRILLQGGSFALGLREDLLKYYPDTELNYVNYCTYLFDNEGGFYWLNDSWDQLGLNECLDETDCVVIELNEARMHKYSNGFVSCLNTILDSYTVRTIVPSHIEKIAFNEAVSWDDKALMGYYAREAEQIWVNKYSVATIKDQQISEKGLDIKISITEQLFANNSEDVVHIYINGVKMYENVFSSSWEGTIHFSPDDLQKVVAQDGIYNIHITGSASFIPKELGINEDGRELALLIKYMGVAE